MEKPNHLEIARGAFADLLNPNGKLDANTAANTIVNNLQADGKDYDALDKSEKKDKEVMLREFQEALLQRLTRRRDEIVADLKNPNGEINATAATALINENSDDRKKLMSKLGIKENEKEDEARKNEVGGLISKRHVREAMVVWNDLKSPEGTTDAAVAKFLILGSLEKAKANLVALDTTGKTDEKEMMAEFEKALSERAKKQEALAPKETHNNKPGIGLSDIMDWIAKQGKPPAPVAPDNSLEPPLKTPSPGKMEVIPGGKSAERH